MNKFYRWCCDITLYVFKVARDENNLTYINKLINIDKCDVGEKYC